MSESRATNRTASAAVDFDESEGVAPGIVTGVVAALVMGVFAMVASATYQHRGFFTPLYHISALFGSPQSMTESMQRASAGEVFWFSVGPAAVGMATHLVTGAVFGAGFAGLSHVIRRRWLVPAGAVYGMVVFLLSPYVLLPLAAGAAGAGDVISEMASLVGWATFAVEHALYGIVLGAAAMVATRHNRP